MEENRRHSPGHIQPCLRLRRPPGHAAVEIFRSDSRSLNRSIREWDLLRPTAAGEVPALCRGLLGASADAIQSEAIIPRPFPSLAQQMIIAIHWRNFRSLQACGPWMVARLLWRLLPNVHRQRRRRSLDNEVPGPSRHLTVIVRDGCLCRFDLSATHWFGHSSKHGFWPVRRTPVTPLRCRCSVD
jgi:hypothetical protein